MKRLRSCAALLGRFPDWLCLLPLLAFAVFYGSLREINAVSLDVMSCFQLAGPFASAMILLAGFAFVHDCTLSLPRKERRLTLTIGFVGWLVGTLVILGRYQPEFSTPLTRSFEAAALSTVGCVVFLLIFLLTGGFLSVKETLAGARRLLAIWGGFCIYQILAGFYLTYLIAITPELDDPALMRMDLSFGFLPAWSAIQASVRMPWLAWVNEWGYPLLGFLISFVAFRLHVARAYAHARRCLLAVLMVGTLGILCYWIVPAVGPIFVYPKMLDTAVVSMTSPEGKMIRDQIVNGADTVKGYPDLSRNVFPSLHTGFTLVVLIAAWAWRKGFFWLCLPLGIVQIMTALTKGVHYAVDLIAAFPLAILCWWLADALLSLRFEKVAPEGTMGKWVEARRRALTVGFFTSQLFSVLALYFWKQHAPIPPAAAYALSAAIVLMPFGLGAPLVRRVGL